MKYYVSLSVSLSLSSNVSLLSSIYCTLSPLISYRNGCGVWLSNYISIVASSYLSGCVPTKLEHDILMYSGTLEPDRVLNSFPRSMNERISGAIKFVSFWGASQIIIWDIISFETTEPTYVEIHEHVHVHENRCIRSAYTPTATCIPSNSSATVVTQAS